MPAPKAAANPTKVVGNNVATLLNATGSALPEQANSFNPLATWGIEEFRQQAKLQTPFLSKNENIVCIITKPNGQQCFCGISKNAKKLITEEGFVKSKLQVSVMPASKGADGTEYVQGFLMHTLAGSGKGLDFFTEVD
jgi:hypothetical protein